MLIDKIIELNRKNIKVVFERTIVNGASFIILEKEYVDGLCRSVATVNYFDLESRNSKERIEDILIGKIELCEKKLYEEAKTQ